MLLYTPHRGGADGTSACSKDTGYECVRHASALLTQMAPHTPQQGVPNSTTIDTRPVPHHSSDLCDMNTCA